MSRPHLIAGLCFLGLAAFLGLEARKLGYYSSLGPGAGFFPLWLSLALGALSLTLLAGAARGRIGDAGVAFLPPRDALLRIIAIVLGLSFVLFTLDLLGFTVAMAIFGVWTMLVMGSRSVVQIGIVALLGSVGSKALFVDLLGVALPAGKFGW